MDTLNYPFDSKYILKNKIKIKKELLQKDELIEKKIAFLGGSTTSLVKEILELFLLNYGIKPVFYESEYNMFYEDAVFPNAELDSFNPDIVYIHTSNVNIINRPNISNTKNEVDDMLNKEYNRFETIWNSLNKKFDCIIIQNNFEYNYYRLLGNLDSVDYRGFNNFISKLNLKFYEYKEHHNNFYINDINYVSSCYGLDKWCDEFYYHMYKYICALDAIPSLSFNLAKIIKAIYGKNKKAFALDLDNTLWGGIIGDDGVENIHIGPDFPTGQVYYCFQEYLKNNKDLGVILNINSKNEYDIALEGLESPNNLLKKEDFIIIKANWNPKSLNIKSIAEELNLGSDSFVFVDDNPAERQIVRENVGGIALPEIDAEKPYEYIRIIDHNGYFEPVSISLEDKNKSLMYQENAKRSEMMNSFEDYNEYLLNLQMKGEICTFKEMYYDRISQLSNKSNQFNLTTRRYSRADIERIALDPEYIGIYSKLSDIFGDNGLISVVIGKKEKADLHIELWIMSCRVLKRNVEFAMLDKLVELCRKDSINSIYGYYYPTKKNKMVSELYDVLGFDLIDTDGDGNKTYKLDIAEYTNKNNVIEVTE